ncbi:transglycosylase SLT domain-containing protein [Chitinilyticum piscinae]|uniref:Transglycosylase SLT domain-containing protein n=1 Tax=Chitinilyticum piscinae TaxID=2866724 RepID=A0A8J7K1J4_9NEIS|nr:transglycosylase SLT domain-containing protein [Chitinilyticum piscinae]MBE9609296.1 transglycosylase SLT domain-containing protein [Chitinilyticum piscinae]
MSRKILSLLLCATALISFSNPAFSAEVGSASAPHPALLREPSELADFDPDNPPERIRVLVALGPSTYFLKDGAPHGVELAMLTGYERYLNQGRKKNRAPVQLQFIPVDATELLPALLAGRGEVAAGFLPASEGTGRVVDFTIPYRNDRYCVAGPRSMNAASFDELGEQKLQIPSASYQARWLQGLNEARQLEGKSTVSSELLSAGSAIEPLLAGMQADSAPTVALQLQLELWAKAAPGAKRLFCSGDPLPLAWAVRKGNEGLRDSLNRYLSTQGSALVGRAISQTQLYLRPDGKARTATEFSASDKLGLFAPAFQMVAEATDMDWLLLAAIAQKESKFTNYIRRNGGPTGIMQVNPATARAMGVKDPHDAEQNIMAAGRYLDYLRDQYKKQGVSDTDALYFMIGAYNAGEGRLQQLRRQAAAQGLDPNRWVGHVETVANNSVGRRMVDYVASVNKIYLAYKAAENSRVTRKGKMAPAASAPE